MMQNNLKSPFVTTHKRKKDNLEAMLLFKDRKKALFRVRWGAGNSAVDNTTITSATRFGRTFAAI